MDTDAHDGLTQDNRTLSDSTLALYTYVRSYDFTDLYTELIRHCMIVSLYHIATVLYTSLVFSCYVLGHYLLELYLSSEISKNGVQAGGSLPLSTL